MSLGVDKEESAAPALARPTASPDVRRLQEGEDRWPVLCAGR